MLASLILALSFSSQAAPRAVPITTTTEGIIKISNPSPHPAGYTIVCSDKVTGSTIVNETHSLPAGGSKTYTSVNTTNACTSSYATNVKVSGQVVSCVNASYVSPQEATSGACGTGFQVCTIPQLLGVSLAVFPTKTPLHFSPVASGNWLFDYGSPSVYDVSSQTAYWYSTSSNKCHAGPLSTDPFIVGCSTISPTKGGSVKGAFCCSTNNGFDSCLVTLSSTNNSGAFLTSPQFKGGSPF